MTPFRWDLVTPDQLGSLLDGAAPPDLWFRDDLVACAGKVLARSGDGDLVFVGRSLDSMFDLLGGALAGVPGDRRLSRLPFSFRRPQARHRGPWRLRPLTVAEQTQARRVLADVELTPYALARRTRPVTFVDVVAGGGTFGELFDLLHRWIVEEREQWPVIRRKLRGGSRRWPSPGCAHWPARYAVERRRSGAQWMGFQPSEPAR